MEHQLTAWRVDDLEAEVSELRGRGVQFEEYGQPDLRMIDGIAGRRGGRAAWLKDCEGNTITISQLG